MVSFTKRSGTLENKVYERLRKRSYRNRVRFFFTGRSPWGFDLGDMHSAYVEGVRDAIKELREASQARTPTGRMG